MTIQPFHFLGAWSCRKLSNTFLDLGSCTAILLGIKAKGWLCSLLRESLRSLLPLPTPILSTALATYGVLSTPVGITRKMILVSELTDKLVFLEVGILCTIFSSSLYFSAITLLVVLMSLSFFLGSPFVRMCFLVC